TSTRPVAADASQAGRAGHSGALVGLGAGGARCCLVLPVPEDDSWSALPLVTREGLMCKYTYLRAYMAGIVVPTIFLLVIMVVFSVGRFSYHVRVPFGRLIVLPHARVSRCVG